MKWVFPTLLTAFVVLFRFAGIQYPELLNVTPLFALFLCFGKELAGYIYIPIFGFLFSSIALDAYYGYSTNISSLCLTGFALYGTYLIGCMKDVGLFGKTFVATTGFFVLTSTMSWYANPAYGSGVLAWANAIVIGESGYPPAYLFYLKSLIGNFGFALLFDLATKYHLSHDNPLRVLR